MEKSVKEEIDITVVKKYSSQEKYDRVNTRQIKLKFNLKTDRDILAWLDRQENKQGAIKKLIRAEIK